MIEPMDFKKMKNDFENLFSDEPINIETYNQIIGLFESHSPQIESKSKIISLYLTANKKNIKLWIVLLQYY